jgi:hypothetical protein
VNDSKNMLGPYMVVADRVSEAPPDDTPLVDLYKEWRRAEMEAENDGNADGEGQGQGDESIRKRCAEIRSHSGIAAGVYSDGFRQIEAELDLLGVDTSSGPLNALYFGSGVGATVESVAELLALEVFNHAAYGFALEASGKMLGAFSAGIDYANYLDNLANKKWHEARQSALSVGLFAVAALPVKNSSGVASKLAARAGFYGGLISIGIAFNEAVWTAAIDAEVDFNALQSIDSIKARQRQALGKIQALGAEYKELGCEKYK